MNTTTHNPVLREVHRPASARASATARAYADITNRLLYRRSGCPADEYLLLADFESYRHTQQRVGRGLSGPQARGTRCALINIARSGIFAADRSIAEYADNIWHVEHR